TSKSRGKEDPVTAGKGMESKDGETPNEMSDVENPVQERKLHLQEECRTVTEHLHTYLGRAEQLLQENKRLQKEAQDTQEQSQAQLRCGAKRSQDPPGLVITLNEQNCQDLARFQLHKEELIPQYDEKEQEARSSLRAAEAEASLLDMELEELEPYRDLSVRAEQRVRQLQKELRVTRIRCAEESHSIRSRFVQEKADCEREFQQRMQELTWRAEEVALRALIRHVQQVKAENRGLRQELLGLLQHCRLLREARVRLRDEQEQLLREER
ncbi:CC166 protein, partial [Climacteris rufus]|nr:CC166 protein [Climacteris rufus]